MSIIINGMEMPKSCYVCPFCDYVSARCDAVKGNPYTPESRYEKRADFCPLVPVPPHGRLGDLDVLIDKVIAKYLDHERKGELVFAAAEIKQDIVDLISDAPTIIPEEEEMK